VNESPAPEVRPRRGPAVFDDRSRFLDRFGLLLLVTVLSIVILSLVPVGGVADTTSGWWAAAVASLLVGVTLALALRASGLAGHLQRIADAIVLLTIAGVALLAVIETFTTVQAPPIFAAPLLVVALSILAPVVVVRRLLKHRHVTRGTMLGAISGYLLIPIAYFFAFLAVTPFVDGVFFATPEPTTSYMYFSLSTVSTVGYGDLAVVPSIGRLLASSEAIVGQVYLVTFVALIVGLYAATRVGGDQGSGD
jgi:hypothetical protein